MVAARTWGSQRIRHTEHNPCPVCRSYDEIPRHQGRRCGGYTVGALTYCQREQYASGPTPVIVTETNDRLYRHRLTGLCHCGQLHGGGSFTSTAPRERTPRPPGQPKGNTPKGELTDLYNYHRADGSLSFQVCRYTLPDGGKTFRQRRPDGAGGWYWSTAGADLVLYRLPELLAADPTLPVFIVEGEKDVDRLAELGIVATCNPMGAGKWTHPGYSDALRGRVCVVLPDNDPAGRAHADGVGSVLLRGSAACVKVMALPGLPERGDVSDWLDAGGAPSDLLAWASVWPEYQPSPSAPAPAGDTPPEPPAGRSCRCGQGCCDWRALVTAAARNKGSRDLLATYIGMDDHFRRREHSGYGVGQAFRVSSAYKSKELGCAPGTYTAAAKELSDKGVLAWSVVHRRRGDKRPDGGTYDRPLTHTFLAVPGGPDAALTRFAVLAAEPERRGGRRVAKELPACGSCGSLHVTAACEDCGELLDLSRPASAESEWFADADPPIDPVEPNDSQNQTLLPIYGGEGINRESMNCENAPARVCDGSAAPPGCTAGIDSPDQCWCMDWEPDPRYPGVKGVPRDARTADRTNPGPGGNPPPA